MPDETRMDQPLLVEVAIEPRSKAESEKLRAALAQLAVEDPSLRVSTDQESNQTILQGTSEVHLDDKIGVLKRAHGIDVTIGALQVAHLERPTSRAEAEYTFKKVYGPKGDFAVVKLVVEPSALGKACRFKSGVVGGAIPEEYIAGIEKGLENVLSAGVVAGYPVVDIEVEVIDGKYHDVDSSRHAFECAAGAALRDALQKANSVLLEPIMKVEVVAPVVCVGAVISDLKVRRAQILGQRPRGDATVVDAMVPLITMFGYVNNLRAISRQAAFTMQYDHYAPTPMPGDDEPFRPAIGMRA